MKLKDQGFVSPFYASSPGHSFLAQILDEISQLQPKSLLTPFMSVGNQALRDFIKKWDPDISIFPSYFFNPSLSLEEKNTMATAPYTQSNFGERPRAFIRTCPMIKEPQL